MASAEENKKIILHLIKTIALLSKRQTEHETVINGSTSLLMKQSKLISGLLPMCSICLECPSTFIARIDLPDVELCDRCAAIEVKDGVRFIYDFVEVDNVHLIRELSDLIADDEKHVGTLH